MNQGGTTDGDEPFVPRRMKGFLLFRGEDHEYTAKNGQSRVRSVC